MIFTIFGGGKAKHYEQRKKRSDFGGHRDHATLGLGLRLGLGGLWRTHDIPLRRVCGSEHTSRDCICLTRCLFNGNNFAGSAASTEVCALLCAILAQLDVGQFFL